MSDCYVFDAEYVFVPCSWLNWISGWIGWIGLESFPGYLANRACLNRLLGVGGTERGGMCAFGKGAEAMHGYSGASFPPCWLAGWLD